MGRIRVLPDHLANQIAAGEVVERPASALKELVENSIDAAATQIRVTLEHGGKKRIRIEDNGCGMDRDDCLMALERHATSKLSRAEDLFSIQTLGFRGEALPSIASVSRMTLESRTADAEVGVRVEMHGSKLYKVSEQARPQGTTLTIDQLFFNIPARRKFLRSVETELGWMINLVTQYSMAHVNIHFYLEHDGRVLIDVTPVKTLKERIYQHFGKALLDGLLPFQASREWIKVSGWVSTPSLTKTSRNYQYLFVNGRLVRDKVLNHSIAQAYRGFGDERDYPVVFLFVEIPSNEVDVNVHPAKTEVKFIHPDFVHDTVRDAMRKILVGTKLTVPYRFREANHAEPTPSGPPAWLKRPERQENLPGLESVGPLFEGLTEKAPEGSQAQAVADDNRAQAVDPLKLVANRQAESQNRDSRQTNAAAQTPAMETEHDQAPAADRDLSPYQKFLASLGPATHPETLDSKLVEAETRAAVSSESVEAKAISVAGRRVDEADHQPSLFANAEVFPRILGQFRESYILAELEGDLLLIDQHVAHERILYDRISNELHQGQIQRQALLVPETLELAPGQLVMMEELLPTIRQFGFDLDPFQGNTYIIREIPLFAFGENIPRLVAELLEKAQGRTGETLMEAITDHFAATKACKAAIKINMRLNHEKMEHLVQTLWRSPSPMFCPHGRPIVLKFRNDEIERNFLRR